MKKSYASLRRGLLKTGSPESKSGVPKRVSIQHSRAPFGQEAHAMHAKTYPSLSFVGQVKTNGRSARGLSVVSFENFSIQAKSFAVGIEPERTSENMNQRPQTWHTLWYPTNPNTFVLLHIDVTKPWPPKLHPSGIHMAGRHSIFQVETSLKTFKTRQVS